MSDPIDLAAYADRIGYAGPLSPTLETLTAILNGHTCSIPFENLNVLQHKPILLDNAALQQKLVHDKRGGYCFEQNGLLLAVLEQIGFAARPVAARVRLQTPSRDITPGRTHLFVIVELENQEWVADVGVGPMSLTAPLKLGTQEEQPTPHGTRRIQKEDQKIYHQTLTADGWIDVWESRLEPMPFIDRQIASWYTSTNPNANFAQMLICAVGRPEGERLVLVNKTFTRRKDSDTLETRHLETKAELLDLLSTQFGVQLPADVDLGPPGSPWPT